MERAARTERDKLIKRLLADTGLRVGELLGPPSDLVEQNRNYDLHVRRKGPSSAWCRRRRSTAGSASTSARPNEGCGEHAHARRPLPGGADGAGITTGSRIPCDAPDGAVRHGRDGLAAHSAQHCQALCGPARTTPGAAPDLKAGVRFPPGAPFRALHKTPPRGSRKVGRMQLRLST